MTQVKDMTDQQLNRALAGLMGYSVSTEGRYFNLSRSNGDSVGIYTREESAWTFVPDYCSDHAESQEVESRAIELVGVRYAETLVELISKPSDRRRLEHHPWGIITVALTASPRERAEAAYITLQGAKHNG
ncbi:hypothetical protein [Paenibacillus sp. FSL R10-2734]|uniref:hypothetical protein n=1 Tax=Paenibacillus sp. FSL R10-2734 TaxID=2954691 RepID=UPI0030D71AF3